MNKLIFSVFFVSLLISCHSTKKDTSDPDGFIYSVDGKIPAAQLGFSLTHEHVMSMFGAEPADIPGYNKDSLFSQVIPYLKKVKALGVNSVFDCTTAYFGRDVRYLKEIADSTGLTIITNTGYYGAANDRYVPDVVFAMSEEEIAGIWTSEFDNGIDGTGIRPGFIKLGFDPGVSETDLKLFKAGIIAHLNTGLTLAVHTGDNVGAAERQLQLLETHQVDPSAWVWVHAHKVQDDSVLIRAAQKSAWISLDNINESLVDDYVRRIFVFREYNLLNRILLSHDGNSYKPGRRIRQFHVLMTHLIPALKKAGMSDEEIHLITVTNPRNAFKVEIRRKS